MQKITPVDAKKIMDTQDDIYILDVRDPDELDEGYIDGSVLIPLDEVAQRAESLLPDKDKTLLVYCRSGKRSKDAAEILDNLGYKNVYDFGGILDWPFDLVI
ncbi:MAG: rhodanese-like domain-containing protein [Firmicutes bacterium]|nr:rhodanese-like domain-containing protein [Bacillota bacterium]